MLAEHERGAYLQRIYAPYCPGQRCSVPGCAELAVVTVALEDHVVGWGHWYEQDMYCPYLCDAHLEEDRRRHRDASTRPFTNCCFAKGRTKYLPLEVALRQMRRTG